MGKRDHRLRSPEDFRRALRTKPLVKAGPIALYRISLENDFRIGFVLPKKLIKSAVKRNQVKRWCRALFMQYKTQNWNGQAPFAVVVRAIGPMVQAPSLSPTDRAAESRNLQRLLAVAFLRVLSP